MCEKGEVTRLLALKSSLNKLHLSLKFKFILIEILISLGFIYLSCFFLLKLYLYIIFYIILITNFFIWNKKPGTLFWNF